MASDDEILDAALDGLADELELERELGVRAVEVDREAIGELAKARTGRLHGASVRAECGGIGDAALPQRIDAALLQRTDAAISQRTGRGASPTRPQELAEPPRTSDSSTLPVAFVHDRPLSPKAVAMMAKTIVALGHADAMAPVVVTRPIPRARRYVFLGNRALQAYLPGLRVEENARFRTPKGVDALLVKSPEEIVRFATETPAVRQAKVAMWSALKAFARNV